MIVRKLRNTHNKRPPGALSEKERYKLIRSAYYASNVLGKYYLVVGHSGKILDTVNRFTWNPEIGYYFKNYWYALAYSLQLMQKNAKETPKNT
jgi:hypothetical protein